MNSINLISCGGIICNDDKILLAHPTGAKTGEYVLPKGLLDRYDAKKASDLIYVASQMNLSYASESECQITAVREVYEETGYKCKIIKKLNYVYVFDTKLVFSDFKNVINDTGHKYMKAKKYVVMYIMKLIDDISSPSGNMDGENNEIIWVYPEDICNVTVSRQTINIIQAFNK